MPDAELNQIRTSKLNPRGAYSQAGLDELADSMRQVGIIEPIVVRRAGDMYEIVVGERRYRAAQQAGLERVPIVVKDYTDHQVMEVNLVENVQREDLTAVDKGRICKRLLEEFPDRYPSRASLARRLGVNSGSVGKWLETLNMPDEVQRLIAPETERRSIPPGKVDYDTVVRISRQVKEPKKFVEVIEQVAEKRIPRRLATQVGKQIAREPDKPVELVFREVVELAPIVLPFSHKHANDILREAKTQTSRKAKDPRLKVGATVRAAVTHFADLEVLDMKRKRLGDFDDEDAKREGGYSLEEFKQVWESFHGEWNPDETVNVIGFRLIRAIAEPNGLNGGVPQV